ncbi:MAG: transcriptional repressor LexA [Acidobacteriota bacterium]
MRTTLTPRRKQILEYLERYIAQHGYAPTIQEIGRHFHLNSTATVHKHLTALEQIGLIERSQHRTRAIECKGGLERLPESAPEVPLLGRIAAGRPIEAILLPETTYVPKDLLGRGRVFALQVQGDSMINDGIFNKDIIVVLAKQTAENGQIVVALVDGQQATVKKFYQEKQRVRLQPANEAHKPLVLDPDRVQIQGVVIAVIRRY